jgi:hypothetical protein
VTTSKIENLIQRYERDPFQQFVLILGNLEDSQKLILHDDVRGWRQALVLLDQTADILLSRRVDSIAIGAGHVSSGARLFDRHEKRQLSKFPGKLKLAAGVGIGKEITPVLSRDDRAVLQLAHVHRNLAYHQDRHDEQVLRLITALQLEAVCRLWPKTTPDWHFGGVSDDSRLAEAVAPYDVLPIDGDGLRRRNALDEAAETVAAQLAVVAASEKTVQAHLGMNLLDRVDEICGVIAELQRDGIDMQRFLITLRNTEFWDREGDDPEMVRLTGLTDRHARIDELDENHRFPAEVEQEMEEANGARNQRYVELAREFVPRANLTVIKEASEKSEALTKMPFAAAIDIYRKLDKRLSDLEKYIPEVVNAWGRFVDMQVTAALED